MDVGRRIGRDRQFADAYNKAGGPWVDNAIAGADQARSTAINRIVGGNPPTAAQFNTSKQFLDLIDQGLLNNVDDVAAKKNWSGMFPPSILDSIKIKGHFYAVPVDIHMPAWFFYSKPAFQKAGITAEPKTTTSSSPISTSSRPPASFRSRSAASRGRRRSRSTRCSPTWAAPTCT